uniref:Putative LOV domain-containing protein n=1 Tax=Leptosira obovata TaxID=53270 RepID=A0A140F7L9_9CHLO|nr:putative LOV domain-containing protein [Leptosira obovata]
MQRELENAVSDFDFAFVVSDCSVPSQPITYASPSFLKLTGYEADEVIGRNCRFLQGPETDQDKVAQLRSAIAKRQEYEVCLLNYRKDGTTFYNQLHISPVFGDGDELKFYVGVQASVSELAPRVGDEETVDDVAHAAIEQLQRKKARDVRKSIEQAPVFADGACAQLPQCIISPLLRLRHSFVLSDPCRPDTPIVFVSDKFLQLSGYSREEVVGRNCRFLQGPGTDMGEVARLKEALHHDPPQPVTVRLLNYRKDGSTFWNALHVAPIRDSSGKVALYVGVQLNVAEVEADTTPESGRVGHAAGDTLPAVAVVQRGVVGAVRVACRAWGAWTRSR